MFLSLVCALLASHQDSDGAIEIPTKLWRDGMAWNLEVKKYGTELAELHDDLNDQIRISKEEAHKQALIAAAAQKAQNDLLGIAGAAETEIKGSNQGVPTALAPAK